MSAESIKKTQAEKIIKKLIKLSPHLEGYILTVVLRYFGQFYLIPFHYVYKISETYNILCCKNL